MKKISVVLLLVALMACKQPSSNNNYEALFTKSMQVKDYQTAITAIQFLLLADSTNKTYLDTLPELYAGVQNYTASEHYTDIALKSYPTNERYLQLKALCLQQTGKLEGVMDIYNKLYAATQKITYLYQIAAFQFSAQDMQAAENSLKLLEEKMVDSKDSVDFMVSETEKQKVPVRAAVYNMKAYMVAQKRDLAGAKKYFEMAIKEYPDFITARQNLQQLMQGGRERQ